VSQREALLSSATIGIGGHADLMLGSAVPALSLFGASSFNLALGLKAGFSLHEWIQIAAGFESLSFSGVSAGYLYGVVTVGSERTNLSVGSATPTAVIEGNPTFGPTAAFLAGTLGLGRYVALASENWWVPALPQLSMVNAGMVRLTAWRLSLGLGAARIAPLRIPMPWIDLAVRVRG